MPVPNCYILSFKQLRKVNESMNDTVSRAGGPTPTSALNHTLQRHNEILQDYAQEFNRAKVECILHVGQLTTGMVCRVELL